MTAETQAQKAGEGPAKVEGPAPLHRRICTMRQIEERTEGRITRRQVEGWVYADQDNFARCVLRIGTGKRARIFIDLDELDAWLEERRSAPRPRLRSRGRIEDSYPRPRFTGRG